MTALEFSDGFDVLASSIAPSTITFNEYEKSLFLTYGQEAIVQNLYNNSYTGDYFESNEQKRRQLDTLVTTFKSSRLQESSKSSELQKSFTNIKDNELQESSTAIKDGMNHYTVNLPTDCWYIIYEHGTYSEDAGECLAGLVCDIIPVSHDEYFRTLHNPFRGPKRKRILRLDAGSNTIELVSPIPINEYYMRYLRKPAPIVLSDFSADGLTIYGVSTPQSCELNDQLHYDILLTAVKLAIEYKTKLLNKN